MQEVKIVLEGGVMPKKATEGAACYDLYVPEDFKLKHGGNHQVKKRLLVKRYRGDV